MSAQIRNMAWKKYYSNLKSAVSKSAFLFYKKFIEPRSKNEDLKRREFILNIFLLCIIILFGIQLLIVLYQSVTFVEYRGLPLVILTSFFLVFLILYILSRKGFFILSSYIFIGYFLMLTTYAVYKWGVELPPGLLFYMLIVVMSGILISTRFAFIITLVISLFIIIIGYLQINSVIHPNLYWKTDLLTLSDVIMFPIIFFIIAAVSWLSNREIEKSLNRAGNAEAELKKERDFLNIKVKERTKELEKTQLDKIAQLYRFAEFGRLSAGLFHDLMNHLTSVSLNMEKVKSNHGGKDGIMKTKSYLDKAIGAAGRMENFVIAVREQISKQKNRILFSLTKEIEQAIQVLAYKAQKADVRINFFALENIQIFGDPIKFNQVATNLIANAIDAYATMNKETAVNNKNREVVLCLSEKNGIINLSVEDWGCGIAQENINKIFESFFTTKNLKGGIGIGLSLTKKIIKKDFRGSIEVESEDNKGSKFVIKFPKNQKNEKTYKHINNNFNKFLPNRSLSVGTRQCLVPAYEKARESLESSVERLQRGDNFNKLTNNNSMNNHFEQLIRAQQEDGSFFDTGESKSVLFTALILSCLNSLKETDEIENAKQKAADFLLLQKNDDWIFSENIAVNFYILSALTEYSHKIIDGAAIAKILMTLTSIEVKEGGPYYSDINKQNEKIDLGVNSAIANFLSLQDVDLPELDKLIDSAIENGDFKSDFFASCYSIVYFISKFYKGDKKEKLIDFILSGKQNGKWDDPLDSCLAITSLVNLGYDVLNLQDEINYLRNYAEELRKPYPFYLDGRDAINRVSAPPALNAAFYFEALNSADKADKKDKPAKADESKNSEAVFNGGEKQMMDKIIKTAKERFSELDGKIRDFAMREIQRTIKGNRDKQMSLMAYYFKKALGEKGKRFPDETIAKLGLVNIFFWTAFIIYDDFWDEEGEPKILPTANMYARNFTKFFNAILPPDSGFNDFFRGLMDKLDAANTWETVYCRAEANGSKIIIPENIPDYGNYEAAYEPASGHILGPVAMLYLLGCQKNSSEIQNLISYFRNYLIAMQINDDAHDWEEDLRRGHLSTVAVMLLKDYQEKYPGKKEIDIDKELQELQKIFWFKTIIKASETAVWHTDRSREALKAMPILEDIAPLERLIIITENVAKKALDEQKKTKDFLEAYKN